MRPVQLLALLLACACTQAPAQDNRSAPPSPGLNAVETEQEQLMERIEREVRLPEGSGALSSYARYYAWQQREDGVRKVVAVYDNLTGAPSGRRWVAETDFPLVMDGGCGLISLSYDVAAQRIEHVTCNGEA
jgi:hypothetical protein